MLACSCTHQADRDCRGTTTQLGRIISLADARVPDSSFRPQLPLAKPAILSGTSFAYKYACCARVHPQKIL